jgi:hypothetical protein
LPFKCDLQRYTERRLLDLTAEKSRLEGIAKLTRATVERERAEREAAVAAVEASKAGALYTLHPAAP